MSKFISRLELLQVKSEHAIPSVVRTVNSAFSPDPLIQWLRPNAAPWSHQDESVCRWQYRRVQSVMLNGEVLQTATVGDIAIPKLAEQAKGPQIPVAEREIQALPAMGTADFTKDLEDAGAVVFLFPPKSQLRWSISRLCRAFKLFILNTFTPAYDTGCKQSRVDQLIAANKKSFEILQTQHSKLWYLEVIAVHPSLQSRGIGGKVMHWVLEHVQEQPICLECTRRENVGFYESFGFEVVDEVELVDEEQKLSYWVMIRPAKRDT